MNYRPIGLQHSSDCDDALDRGDDDRLCDECRAQAVHDWDRDHEQLPETD